MKDQVIMSPNNGHLGIAIPLYRKHYEQELGKWARYTISLTNDKPVAYALDCGPELEIIQCFSAKWVEDNLIFLGDL